MTLKGKVWTPIGPSPIIRTNGRRDNGLVSSITISPSNPNIIYMGTQGGGVWLSKDGGTTWTPIFDRQIPLILESLIVGEPGAIAIDPNNTDIVYVGTSGRSNAFGATTPQQQAGLFKSTDGGS